MFAICALLMGLLASGAAQDGRISGRVIDDNTGGAVPGQSVTLVPDAGIQGAQRVFADKDGRYVFQGVASGGYRIDALAPLRSDQLAAQRHVAPIRGLATRSKHSPGDHAHPPMDASRSTMWRPAHTGRQ
jgi:hypothetical protein